MMLALPNCVCLLVSSRHDRHRYVDFCFELGRLCCAVLAVDARRNMFAVIKKGRPTTQYEITGYEALLRKECS